MALKWRDDLPEDWDDAPDEPPEGEDDFVIESLGQGVIMLPIEASVCGGNTESYLYCASREATPLGEQMA